MKILLCMLLFLASCVTVPKEYVGDYFTITTHIYDLEVKIVESREFIYDKCDGAIACVEYSPLTIWIQGERDGDSIYIDTYTLGHEVQHIVHLFTKMNPKYTVKNPDGH